MGWDGVCPCKRSQCCMGDSLREWAIGGARMSESISAVKCSICDGKCKSPTFQDGCNGNSSVGYCNANGGCNYSSQMDWFDLINWCCFIGC